MDIVYGLKTDSDNSLKGRLGNLKGIHHHLFGWLEGFGELLTNLYAVGDIRLRRTGENLDAKIEMLKSMFATQYQRVRYDITEEENYLKNATFSESMEYWQAENEAEILMQNGEAMLMNGAIYTLTGKSKPQSRNTKAVICCIFTTVVSASRTPISGSRGYTRSLYRQRH